MDISIAEHQKPFGLKLAKHRIEAVPCPHLIPSLKIVPEVAPFL
jgi:hypothetical protein